jgi:ABC-type antimicrobial peptide transport system permease subunit
MNLVLKSSGDPLQLAAPIRELVARLDPAVPVASVRSMEEVVASSIAAPRFTGALLGLFAALALALAGVGVYGVLSWAVGERTQEIGLRVALGADVRHVVRLVVAHALALVGGGLLLGLLLALALSRVIRSLLHEVAPADPITYLAVAAAVGAAAFVAAAVPAWRAARLEPAEALRYE